MRTLDNIILPPTWVALAYLGVFGGHEWAANLSVFAVWLAFVINAGSLLLKPADLPEPSPIWAVRWARACAVAKLLIFVSGGWFVVSSVAVLSWTISENHRDRKLKVVASTGGER